MPKITKYHQQNAQNNISDSNKTTTPLVPESGLPVVKNKYTIYMYIYFELKNTDIYHAAEFM